MSEKSYVSMVQKVCVATGKKYDSGELLFDKRLKESLDRYTTTGWGLSPEVQEKIDEGYIVLVGIDAEKSDIDKNGMSSSGEVYRTGQLMYVREHVFRHIFELEEDAEINKINFVSEDTIEQLDNLNNNKNN